MTSHLQQLLASPLSPTAYLYFQNLSFSASSLCCKWAGKSGWLCTPDFWSVVHKQSAVLGTKSLQHRSTQTKLIACEPVCRGYNFAYARAERMGMKADVNTTSKTWHGTGSGAKACLSSPRGRKPTVSCLSASGEICLGNVCARSQVCFQMVTSALEGK